MENQKTDLVDWHNWQLVNVDVIQQMVAVVLKNIKNEKKKIQKIVFQSKLSKTKLFVVVLSAPIFFKQGLSDHSFV